GGGRLPGPRPERQRVREAARAAYGRRARAVARARADLPLRVSGAARRAAPVPAGDRAALEHQPVPLSEPRLGLRPRARRRSGAARRPRTVRRAPRDARLRAPRRDRQPRLSPVPRPDRLTATPPCRSGCPAATAASCGRRGSRGWTAAPTRVAPTREAVDQ